MNIYSYVGAGVFFLSFFRDNNKYIYIYIYIYGCKNVMTGLQLSTDI